MNIFVIVVEVIFIIAIFLLFIVSVLAGLKALKKDRFANWTFLDYFSVGYVEHLYIKYIKRQ
ncbi:MAG: hypothetical protein V4560_03560 [Bacteroidota bacterium]